MPAPRSFNASTGVAKHLADAALEDPRGVTVTWLAADIGLDACRINARSYQTTFCALRARADRMARNHQGRDVSALDSEVQGMYSSLACVIRPLSHDAGWTFSLLKGRTILDGLNITSAATGETLVGETADDRRFMRLVRDAQSNPELITPEEWAWGCARKDYLADEFEPWFKARRPDLYPSRIIPQTLTQSTDSPTVPRSAPHVPNVEDDALFGHDPVDRSVAPIPVRPAHIKPD